MCFSDSQSLKIGHIADGTIYCAEHTPSVASILAVRRRDVRLRDSECIIHTNYDDTIIIIIIMIIMIIIILLM